MSIYLLQRDLELYHHGIAGQRWGKRNGPPYPLNSSTKSSSELKAKTKKTLSGMSERVEKKKTEMSKVHHERKRETIKSISDVELNKRIERMRKENEYSKLIGRLPVNQLGYGKRLADSVLDSLTGKIIVPMAIGAGAYVIKSKLGKNINREAVNEIFKNVNLKPKKG